MEEQRTPLAAGHLGAPAQGIIPAMHSLLNTRREYEAQKPPNAERAHRQSAGTPASN